MSKHARKQKKQKQRELKNRQKKLREEKKRLVHKRRQEYKALYPSLQFDTEHGDPRFVQLVREAVRTIRFDDDDVFSSGVQWLYRILKRDGHRGLLNALSSLEHENAEMGRLAKRAFVLGFGQAIIDRIPECQRERLLPYNDVKVMPRGNGIRLLFRSLARKAGRNGTIYYSRRKPTIDINGARKIVAFSKHAIERICERLTPRWNASYGALGDVFAFLDQCLHFEPCRLYGGQSAFSFFDAIYEGSIQQLYVTKVLGKENLNPKLGRPYYRLGYCPADIEGDFFRARTLLLPGFQCTPEYTAIVESNLPYMEKRALLDQANRSDSDMVYRTGDFGLIKCFHDLGVPQVVQMRGRVFDSFDYGRARKVVACSDLDSSTRLGA